MGVGPGGVRAAQVPFDTVVLLLDRHLLQRIEVGAFVEVGAADLVQDIGHNGFPALDIPLNRPLSLAGFGGGVRSEAIGAALISFANSANLFPAPAGCSIRGL